MAATPNVDEILEVKFYSKYGNQEAINVLHFRVSAKGGAGLTDLALASELSDVAAPIYQAWFTAQCEFLGASVQIVSRSPHPVAQAANDGAGAGAVAGDTLPSQVAYLIAKRTAIAGRKYRGRVYLPFWPESMNDVNGLPTAGAQAAAQDFALQFFATETYTVGGDSTTLVPVIWTGSEVGAVTITTWQGRAAWATQRRRSKVNRGDSFGPF
jgi:hypothetical protein